MSVYLHGLAGRANLSVNLRAVLTALCDAAGEDDGTKCHPSLAYVSYKTGFSERHIRRLLRTLELASYIEAVAFISGGRGHTTWYHIHIERVPMKPSWETIKKRLIESGELAADDDMPPSPAVVKRAVLKGAEALKGDKMSALVEKALKGDKMSAFSDERGTKCPPLDPQRGTKCPPLDPQRGTKCPPSIPSKKEDSYEDEDSYADVTPTEKKPDEETLEPETPSPLPPSPALAESAELAEPLEPGSIPPERLWASVVSELKRTETLAAIASWILPAHIQQYGWDADGVLRVILHTVGRAHADMLEQRYGYLICGAISRQYHISASHVWLSYNHAPHTPVTPAYARRATREVAP